MSSQSGYLITLFLGRLSPLSSLPVFVKIRLQKNNHSLLPFLNQLKRENDHRKYFTINLHERMLQAQRGSNQWPSDYQSDAQPTGPPRPAHILTFTHSLGIFSRRQIDDIFLIFPRKQGLTIHANCLPRTQFAWNVKSCFLGKIRKIFQNVVCWKFYPEC